jgi:hypothetical protein
MRVQFVERQNGPEKLLCEAEIVFDEEGPLQGMKLVGISLWKVMDGEPGEAAVTFPARSFGTGGERRFFDYLRSVEAGSGDSRRVKDWIRDEWKVSAKAA